MVKARPISRTSLLTNEVLGMEQRILSYRKYMDELLAGERFAQMSKEEREQLKKEHLTQISFFQHERLIHLIVTVAFAVLEMLSVMITLLFPGIATILLTLIVLVLLIPYIRHYYILENEVQKLYGQYDKL